MLDYHYQYRAYMQTDRQTEQTIMVNAYLHINYPKNKYLQIKFRLLSSLGTWLLFREYSYGLDDLDCGLFHILLYNVTLLFPPLDAHTDLLASLREWGGMGQSWGALKRLREWTDGHSLSFNFKCLISFLAHTMFLFRSIVISKVYINILIMRHSRLLM